MKKIKNIPFIEIESIPQLIKDFLTQKIEGFEEGRALDTGIIGARWLTLEEVRATAERHRSPLILRCIEDYVAGKRHPLDLITHYS